MSRITNSRHAVSRGALSTCSKATSIGKVSWQRSSRWVITALCRPRSDTGRATRIRSIKSPKRWIKFWRWPDSMAFVTAILADPVFKEHQTGRSHPERPERMDAVVHALERDGSIKDALRIPVRSATEDELALCHTRPYIEIAKRDVAAGAHDLSTGDTQISPQSFDVALKAAGGLLNAVDAVVDRKASNAFCAVRPPGHHATPDRGMGFCLFNNVAIAARYAQKKHGIARVAIVDW